MRSRTIGIDVAAPPSSSSGSPATSSAGSGCSPTTPGRGRSSADPDGALVVEFVARRPLVPVLGLGLPVAWRARTWTSPRRRRLRFVHVAGATRGMDVTWRIEPRGRRLPRRRSSTTSGRGCRASRAFVDRVFTRPIAGRTLATFKALAEALADEADVESDPTRAATNPST